MVRRRLTTGPSAALAALIAVTALVGGCGGSDNSTEELREAREQGAAHARQQERLKDLEGELKNLKKERGGSQTPSSGSGSGSSAVVSEGSMSCGNELTVGPSTSCPFAENVRSDYYSEIGSGSGVVYSYSPVTEELIEMSCTAGTPHVCTGGRNASVYFP